MNVIKFLLLFTLLAVSVTSDLFRPQLGIFRILIKVNSFKIYILVSFVSGYMGRIKWFFTDNIVDQTLE